MFDGLNPIFTVCLRSKSPIFDSISRDMTCYLDNRILIDPRSRRLFLFELEVDARRGMIS